MIVLLRELYFYMDLGKKEFVLPFRRSVFDTFVLALVIVACVYFRGPGSEFIYFQF